MPYCSILECKNDSRRKTLKNAGVSYHRFPRNPDVKEKWIDATGRKEWFPVKESVVCSKHFLEDDFFISAKGYRYIKPSAFPRLKVVKYFYHTQPSFEDNDDTAGTSKVRKLSESSDLIPPEGTKDRRSSVDLNDDDTSDTLIYLQNTSPSRDEISVQGNSDSDCADSDILTENNINNPTDVQSESTSSMTTRKLEGHLRYCKNKIIKQHKKIKRLQSLNLRLRKKVANTDAILLKLVEKISESQDKPDYCVLITDMVLANSTD